MKTEQQVIEDRVAAKARHVATIAVASGSVAKNAFMATVTGSRTVGEKAVVFGALVGLVAYLLPWVTLIGTFSGSGLRLALDGSGWFWLHPVSMILCFVMAAFLLNADAKKRILAARWYIVIGTVWFVPGIAVMCNMLSGVVGFGGYLATAGAGAVLLGGILQIGERLHELSDTN